MAKGSIEKIGGDTAISSVINKFGDKLWFQIIIAFWLTIGPILFVANPFINNYLGQHTQRRYEVTKAQGHKDAFENSKQVYALVKKEMNESLDKIGCDYVFLIEFHNGNENVMTGIQFCRFDMTLQVSSKDLSYIGIDKFRDDIVARYDILLSDELNSGKLLYFTNEEFEKNDRYLAQQLKAIDAVSYAILNLKDKNNKVFGSLMCVSSTPEKKLMYKSEIYSCAREIEMLFNNVNN